MIVIFVVLYYWSYDHKLRFVQLLYRPLVAPSPPCDSIINGSLNSVPKNLQKEGYQIPRNCIMVHYETIHFQAILVTPFLKVLWELIFSYIFSVS